MGPRLVGLTRQLKRQGLGLLRSHRPHFANGCAFEDWAATNKVGALHNGQPFTGSRSGVLNEAQNEQAFSLCLIALIGPNVLGDFQLACHLER